MSTYSKQTRRKALTLLSAPARELNLVAVTTLFFFGSTAPMATSGVSTIATNFGGAVNIAALPNLMGNVPAGVSVLVDVGLIDVLGVLARVVELILNLLLVVEALETLAINDGRREEDCELDMRDEVERARDESVRVRGTVGTVLRLADNDMGEATFGEGGPISLLDVGVGFVLASSASSCHWRCMMIDLVAHCKIS